MTQGAKRKEGASRLFAPYKNYIAIVRVLEYNVDRNRMRGVQYGVYIRKRGCR